MSLKFDHRGDRRLHLKKPARGLITAGPVEILDMSMTGIGVAHDFELEAGTETFLEFSWSGTILQLWCTVAHCRTGKGALRYRSGLIVRNRTESERDYRKRVRDALAKLRESERELPPAI